MHRRTVIGQIGFGQFVFGQTNITRTAVRWNSALWSAACNLLWLLCLTGVARAADAPSAALRFPDDQFVTGTLEPSNNPDVIRWQSPAFKSPFEFDIDQVGSIQFPVPDKLPLPKGSFCFELAGGDMLFGTPVSLNAKLLVVQTERFGRLHLHRDHVLRFYRWRDGTELIYAGPNGLAEWRTPADAPATGWSEESGCLRSELSGAALYRNFGLPAQAVIELAVSWKKKADFVVGLGVDDRDAATLRSAFTIEVWDNHLVLQRETAKEADLESLQWINSGAGTAHVYLYLDQQAGRCVVCSTLGARLADLHVAVADGKTLPGILLKNKRGDVQLDRLRIGAWDGQLPADAQGQVSHVQLSGGKVLSGVISEFDEKTQEFTAQTEAGQQRLPLQQVAGVSLNVSGNIEPRQLRTSHLDGTQLSGSLESIGAGTLRISAPGILESIETPVSMLRALVILDPITKPIPRLAARLEMDGVKLRGVLEDNAAAEVDGGLLLWKPLSSATASLLRPGIPARLVFRDSPSEPVVASAHAPAVRVLRAQPGGGGALLAGRGGSTDAPRAEVVTQRRALHLRTGDTVPCDVKRIDEAGVYFVSAASDATFVPHAQVKAVELIPYPGQGNSKTASLLRKAKRERLLTLPRMQKGNPPTQIIEATTGDYLRGRLLSLDEDRLLLEVRLEKKTIPRDRIARIIWLHPDELDPEQPQQDAPAADDALPAAPADLRVQTVRTDGARLTFVPGKYFNGILSGKSDLLGECWVDVKEIDELLIARAIERSASQLALQQFKLHHAEEPKASLADGESSSDGMAPGLESGLVGKPAPLFELELLGGPRFVLAEARGRVVVLDFFATWCGPCVQSMPQVEAAVKEFANDGVKLVGVNLEETPEKISALLERQKLELSVALDRNGAVAAKYEASAIPQTVIIDRNGNVFRVFVGAGPNFGEQLREAIRAVLAKNAPAANPAP